MYGWSDTKTVTIDVEDIISEIPTRILKEEYEDRQELQRTDPKQAERDERWRTCEIDIDINLDDNDLLDKDNVDLDIFEDCQIISYLEEAGYSVFENSSVSKNECSGISVYMNEVPNWKFKEIMCDTLGLSHMATKEEIINEIKNRL